MSMETDKIILRPWRESDAEALFKYASDPNVGPRAGWPPHKSVEESLEIIRTVFHNDHTWAIELKQTGESIGCIGYYLYGESNITIGEHDAEVGYWVAKPYWNQGICSESLRLIYWNQGICSESLRLMIDYCFQEQHFEVLWCDCFVDNPASERVMHKCGFRDTGAFNLCSHLYLGDDRLVKIMRLNRFPKILFLHGFYASGQCVPAVALREAFAGRTEVLTPDLPMHPHEAMEFISDLTDREKPDLLIGNSCGAFYAQMIAPVKSIPALLGNPHFQMSEFLMQRIGQHEYKSPRKDGKQSFVIDEALVKEFAALEATQFDNCNPQLRDQVWGLFGEQDTLAHFEPLFLKYYSHSFHFPGGHTPTAQEVRTWYVPLAEKLLIQ